MHLLGPRAGDQGTDRERVGKPRREGTQMVGEWVAWVGSCAKNARALRSQF